MNNKKYLTKDIISLEVKTKIYRQIFKNVGQFINV